MTTHPARAHLADAHALAIGISRYQHIRPLPEVHDAEDVAAALIDPALAGYPPGNVRTLLDGAATRAAILDGLDQLARSTTDASTVVLYFSGHGGRVVRDGRDTCYLLPVDARVGDAAGDAAIEDTAISGDELSARLRSLRAARVTVLLDCCRASGIAEPRAEARDVDAPLAPELTARSLTPLAQGRGRAVLAASRSDGFAYVVSGQRNGVFTRHLLDGLRGAAEGAGGVIRICDLFHYVQQRVAAEGAQRPVFRAELEENYPIALYRGGAAPAVALPPSADAMAYDAFVSYHRADPADRAWVEQVLVPRLESLGLQLCLEHRDFRLARPRIREIERAVTSSRYTISVFTPSYLDSTFQDFESLLAQHQGLETRAARFIPLIRRPCRPALGVRMVFAPILDLSRDADVDAGLARLAVELRRPPASSQAG